MSTFVQKNFRSGCQLHDGAFGPVGGGKTPSLKVDCVTTFQTRRQALVLQLV